MRVVADQFVNAVRDRTPLFGCQRALRPAEVEAHAIDPNPRTGLIDLIAEHVFERSLQKMRRRMMPANLTPPRFEDPGADSIPGRKLSLDDAAVMRDRFAHVLRIANVEERALLHNLPAIADLSAAFGIERRAIQNQHAFVSLR